MMKNNWLLSTVWVNFISGIVESSLYKRCAIALACCAHVSHRLSSRKAVNFSERCTFFFVKLENLGFRIMLLYF